jgi:hypothetical protein
VDERHGISDPDGVGRGSVDGIHGLPIWALLIQEELGGVSMAAKPRQSLYKAIVSKKLY